MAENYPLLNSNDDFIPYSTFHSVLFHIAGDEENKIDSNVEIDNKEFFKGALPANGGLYDPHMGTTDHSYPCAECGNRKTVCPGHFGSVRLKYPLKNPLFKTLLLKFMKIFCFHCGSLLTIAKTDNPKKIMSETVKQVRAISTCSICKKPKRKIINDKIDPLMFYYETGNKQNPKYEIYNHEIKKFTEKISMEDVKRLGFPEWSHPSKLLVNYIKAPPNTTRPDRKNSGVKNNTSDVTVMLKTLVEYNLSIPDIIPDTREKLAKLRDTYYIMDMTYYDMIKGQSTANNQNRLNTNNNKVPQSVAMGLPKKKGIIRNNLMGKKTHMMMRSVITGDNMLRVDQIGIPINIAKNMPIEEVVVEGVNEKRLQIYFDNGLEGLYPGALSVIKKADGKKYKVELLKDKNYKLQPGDVVCRSMVNGDPVCLNRQPSLLFSNISSMNAVIQEEGDTIRLAVSSCNAFNADFDGDNMNGLVGQHVQSRIEMMHMSDIKNWMISFQNISPMFGSFQDALIGCSEFTHEGVEFDRWHAIQIMSQIDPKNAKLDFSKKYYTSRDLMSMVLPEINIVNRRPKSYMAGYVGYIPYDPNDIFVNIKRGKLLSGVMDKNTVGQGKNGSIYHIINNEYGSDRAIETIYNIQQIVTQYFYHQGFTTGVSDLNVPKETEEEINNKLSVLIQKSRKLINDLDNDKLIPPIGQSLHDYFEEEALSKLQPGDDFANPIFSALDIVKNGLVKLIMSGSKGKINNLLSINGAIGQATINGRRMPRHCGLGRTSPYFTRYDLEPESCGFIGNSFRQGIQSKVYPFACAEARFGEIAKALATSISGAQNRISIKNLESIITDNLRKSVKNFNIIQPLYAEGGIDPRRNEKVKFITSEISDKTFEEKFYVDVRKNKFLSSKFKTKKHQEILNLEFKQLQQDRDEYRDIFMRIENDNNGVYIFGEEQFMPVNVFRIIKDTLFEYKDDAKYMKKDLDPLFVFEKVQHLCNNIPYKYMNDIQESLKKKIPQHYITATHLLKILFRTYLNTGYLLKEGINDDLLEIIIDRIILTFQKSLIDNGMAVGIIAAQCVSEPMTQYVLDSKHRSGAGGGTKTNTLVRIKEILGAKPTHKLKNPLVSIIPKEEFMENKEKVQEIANHIEMLPFNRFISGLQVFFEKYGNPVHPKYLYEKDFIRKFEKFNAGVSAPGDLTKWCIRFDLNREQMIAKNMKVFTIVTAIRREFPFIHIVYSPENAQKLILRCYLRQPIFKNKVVNNETPVVAIVEDIKKVIIRGIQDVENTDVLKKIKTYVDKDGSVKTKKIFYIQAAIKNYNKKLAYNYTFMEDILSNPYVDKYKTQCDSIIEFEKIYGVRAARHKIISEIINTLEGTSPIHASVYADEMVYSGKVTSIQKTGLQKREPSNVTLRLSFQSPIQVIEQSAIQGTKDYINGISGPLIMGMAPRIGTTYNRLMVDREAIKKKKEKIGDDIDDL